jgi:hypothetical protein
MSLQEAALARQAQGLLGLVETGVEGSVSGSGAGLVDSDAAEPSAFSSPADFETASKGNNHKTVCSTVGFTSCYACIGDD